MRNVRFHHFAWATLSVLLGVIAWGAYVRSSGSGAGLGNQWPFWSSEGIDPDRAFHFFVELVHRLTSAVSFVMVVALVVWSRRRFLPRHAARRYASLSLVVMVIEVLLGAGLVKFRLVEDNASAFRAFAVSLHLANTFLLIALVAMTAWHGSADRNVVAKGQGAVGWGLWIGIVATLLLGVSGALTALADTLFPPATMAQVMEQSVPATSHFLIQVRGIHPLLAVSVGLYLILVAGLVAYLRPNDDVRAWSRLLVGLVLAQSVIGLANIALFTPHWLQMVHLIVADVMWIVLLLFAASAMQECVPRTERTTDPAPTPDTPIATRSTWRSYLLLTKPRVISLLLFTTVAAMFAAARGWPGGGLLIAVLVGGYMAAGAANAINMAIDVDVDARMGRTSKRPTVTREVPPTNALTFGLVLALLSFVILTWAANLLAAMLALAGLVFYVIIYTLVLKRRTWHNIVIGGAAGSFPPLVGWAAVTGSLSPLAWLLFAIVFAWTPVHFWALSLLIRDDYAKAGIPMAPVVLGERLTVVQIGLYALLTSIISLLPLVQRHTGLVYLGVVIALNLVLILRAALLLRTPDRPHALSLYKYSMLYLALLFLTLAIDRSL